MLATTLLVTTLLTVMLAASFLLVSAEQRTTDNSFGAARALAIAEAGLQSYFSMIRGLRDTTRSADSVRITVGNGYADVVAQRLHGFGSTGADSLSLWVVRSRGVDLTNVLSGQVQGTRSIAQFAELSPVVPVHAALLAANPVYVNDGRLLNGDDACSTNQPVYGLTTAAGDYAVNSHSGALGQLGIQTLSSRTAVLDTAHVDWTQVVGAGFTADSVQIAAGDYTLPGSGAGLLVVKGNLTVPGNGGWNGVILVGGWLRTQTANRRSANYLISGAVVTGLNNLITPNSVGPDSLTGSGAGNSNGIRWSRCDAPLTLTPLANAWVDTWSTY